MSRAQFKKSDGGWGPELKVSVTPRITIKARAASNPDSQLQAGSALPLSSPGTEEWRDMAARTQTSFFGHI